VADEPAAGVIGCVPSFRVVAQKLPARAVEDLDGVARVADVCDGLLAIVPDDSVHVMFPFSAAVSARHLGARPAVATMIAQHGDVRRHSQAPQAAKLRAKATRLTATKSEVGR